MAGLYSSRIDACQAVSIAISSTRLVLRYTLNNFEEKAEIPIEQSAVSK